MILAPVMQQRPTMPNPFAPGQPGVGPGLQGQPPTSPPEREREREREREKEREKERERKRERKRERERVRAMLSYQKTAIFPEAREGNVYDSNESARGWSLHGANV